MTRMRDQLDDIELAILDDVALLYEEGVLIYPDPPCGHDDYWETWDRRKACRICHPPASVEIVRVVF